MDRRVINEIIRRLDSIMTSTPTQVGVALGYDLFGECQKRGLLSMEEFSVLGQDFLPHRLPAYRGKHFAFVNPELTDWDFQIGQPEHA